MRPTALFIYAVLSKLDSGKNYVIKTPLFYARNKNISPLLPTQALLGEFFVGLFLPVEISHEGESRFGVFGVWIFLELKLYHSKGLQHIEEKEGQPT